MQNTFLLARTAVNPVVEAYARKLIQAGVHVTALRYMGTIHDFVMLNALADTPAARSAVAQANDMLHEVFTK
jgi:acetyl esterase